MRKNFICLLVLFVIAGRLSAQLNESFEDGNFTSDPAWNGNFSGWQIISSDVGAGAANSNTLRLNVATGSGTAYLSTRVMGSWGIAQCWGFFVGRRAQAYTTSNHTLIWLWCSEADLTASTADGYRIRIGDDTGGDDLVLQRVTDGVSTDVLVSSSAILNGLTDIGFLLRVTRTNAGVWEIFTSQLPVVNGSGAVATDLPNAVNTSISQGSATDNTYSALDNGYTGFVNVHASAASARMAQEFDQVQLSFTSAVLPVTLQNFNAKNEGSSVRLSWEAFEETAVRNYEIQKSVNGIHFSTIGSVNAERKRKYSFTDDHPANGNSFYRLRITDIDGSSRLSYVVGVRSRADIHIMMFPNPVSNIAILQHPKADAGGRVCVFSAAGLLVRQLIVPENAMSSRLDLSGLATGLYYAVFISGETKVNRMFVKQ